MKTQAPRRKDEAREESRAKILGAALRLFAHEGYEKTSVKEIAQEAGIAQGLLYHYFDGKEKLLHAIFERSMEDVGRAFAAGAASARPEDALETLLRTSFQIVQQNQDFWRLSYAIRMQPAVLTDLHARIAAWTEEIRRMLEAHLKAQGISNSAIEARLLFALVDGTAQHYTLEPDIYPLDAVTDAIVRRYCPSATVKLQKPTENDHK